MRPPPRLRKTVKWGGLAVCAGSCAAWGVTWRGVAAYYAPTGHGVGLTLGRAWAGRWERGEILWGLGSHWQPYFGASSLGGLGAMLWDFDAERWGRGWAVRVPLWLPAGLGLAGSACAWRLDVRARRRALAGRCARCGYDRAGLPAPAACPECGGVAR